MTIYGRAGAGLEDSSSWAANEAVAAVGAAGEAKTERLLNKIATEHPQIAVFHDIVVPNNRGWKYNIDHAVLAGKTLLLVDSKAWKPGFLWTMGGKTRRGFEAFPSADKKSVEAAFRDIAAILPSDISMPTPLVVVWPTNQKKGLSMWAASYPGAKLVRDGALERTVRRMAKGSQPADQRVVSILTPHLKYQPRKNNRFDSF